jgi:hypothetical protein
MEKNLMSNGWETIPKAVYSEQMLPEYADNPFICALPPILGKASAIKALKVLPSFNDKEINLPPHVRVHAMQRLLGSFFQPSAQHITLETRFSILIRQGYIGRNPATSDFIKHLNNGYDRIAEKDIHLTTRTDVTVTANSFSIVGTSGCGKSLAIRRILDAYPKAIYHPELHIIQVPWLKLECPSNGSLKELCKNFFVALDNRLGTQYRKRYGKARTGVDELIAEMAQLAQLHAIGVLIIDEIQNLSVHRSGGEAPMLNFFVALVNDVGIPVVLVGTPKARRLFAKDFSQARRSSGLGSVVWERFKNDGEWKRLVSLMWGYQWLKHKTPITDELRNTLYDCSQGVIDILVKLFVLSQWRAMMTKIEELSAELIRTVYKDEFKAVHPMLDALRSNKEAKIAMFGDLKMPDIEEKMIQAFAGEIPVADHSSVLISHSEEPDKVEKLLNIALGLGLEQDIALPLIETEIGKNPSLDIMNIIHRITSLMMEEKPNSKKQKPSKKPKVGGWQHLPSDDMRSMYFHKGDSSMHHTLKEKGIVISIADFLKTG